MFSDLADLTVDGRSRSVNDEDAFSLNAGVGGKFFISDSMLFRVDGKYRHINEISDSEPEGNFDIDDDALSTIKVNVGFSWVF